MLDESEFDINTFRTDLSSQIFEIHIFKHSQSDKLYLIKGLALNSRFSVFEFSLVCRENGLFIAHSQLIYDMFVDLYSLESEE